MPATGEASPLVWRLFARGLIRHVGRVALRPDVGGASRIPARGGAVVAFNHDSYLDALLVAQLTQRPLRFMVMAEVLRVPVLGQLMRSAGMFSVERNAGDVAAVRTAVEICSGGGLVGIFPEGRLFRGASLGPIRRGAARIALEAGVPIVPVAIGGHDPPWRERAFVRVGEPLLPEGDAESLTSRLEDALRALLAGPQR
jgi:1-acyl-sn-glycerol-3-phosphate acyltransferase